MIWRSSSKFDNLEVDKFVIPEMGRGLIRQSRHFISITVELRILNYKIGGPLLDQIPRALRISTRVAKIYEES